MDKKWLVITAVIVMSGLGFAQVATLFFNQPVEAWNSDSRGFVVVENYLSPKDHFRVDTTPGGKTYTTSIEPIGSPNPMIGTATNPYATSYVNNYKNQLIGLTASNGITCNSQCATQSWTCVNAVYPDNTPSSCTDTGRMKDCICKNT